MEMTAFWENSFWQNNKEMIFAAALLVGLILLWRIALYIKFTWYRFMSMKRVDAMEGTEFEEYLAYLFRRDGYRVRLTKASSDFGADLILYREEEKIAVQAKRYGKPVGVAAVQQVLAARQFYECTGAMVVTNMSFTRQAKQLAAVSEVTLLDREDLLLLMGKKKEGEEDARPGELQEDGLDIAFHAKVSHPKEEFLSEKMVYSILQEALEDHGYSVDGD